MTDERLALIVRSAFRGMMEAVLESGEAGQSLAPPDFALAQEASRPAQAVVPDEIPFPSVTAAEETLFGETPPPTMSQGERAIMAEMDRKLTMDMDGALAMAARMRAQREQDAAPDVQGGPGEKEVAEWLRIPMQQ